MIAWFLLLLALMVGFGGAVIGKDTKVVVFVFGISAFALIEYDRRVRERGTGGRTNGGG